MRKFLKPRLLILLFWVLVVFGSIATLPNLQDFVAQQVTKTSTTTTLTKNQREWGHGLANTQSVTLVFNNPNGKMTAAQHRQIRNVLSTISARSDDYGIKQLRTSYTMTNDQQLLTSRDGSTELAIAALKSSAANLDIVAGQLNRAIAVSGLNTAVTSPSLVRNEHATSQIHQIISVFLIGSALLLLILGLIFRSLLVPLINLLTQVIIFLTSTSLITNLVNAWHLPFNISSVLIAGGLGLIVTTLLSWSYMHDYWAEAVVNDGAPVTALATLKVQGKRWGLVVLPLVLLTGILSLTPWATLTTAWPIGLTLIITSFATPTLSYALTAILGDSIYWPSTRFWTSRSKNIWGQLARLSHWQPLLGLGLTAILLVPGLLNAKAQYADDGLQPARQAELSVAEYGQQLVTAHFGNGAAAPLTLTIHSTKVLTTQRALQTLDQLTTKLQHLDNVAQVTSVTQPTGKKLSPFYVSNQLATIKTDLLGKQTIVTTLQQQLALSQTALQAAQTAKHAKTIDRLSTRLNRVADANDDLSQRLYDLNTTLAAPRSTSRSRRLASEFDRLERLTDHMTNLLNDVVDTQTTVIDQGTRINRQVRTTTKRLAKTTQGLQSLLASLKVTTTYLTGLAASQVGQEFYLPANGQQNARFQNSVFTNVSSDSHTTQLIITFKTAPTSAKSYQTANQLKTATRSVLLATPLAHAKLTTSGITSQQAAHHRLISRHAVSWVGLILGLLALSLWIALRSFTQSTLLIAGVSLVTLASWGWTQLLTNQWFHLGVLSSNVFLWGTSLLVFHWLVIATLTVQRQHWLRQFDSVRLQRHFHGAGQLIWPLTCFEFAYLLPCLLMGDHNLFALGVFGSIGILLSNLIVPLALPGLITWTVHPPILRGWSRAQHRPKN